MTARVRNTIRTITSILTREQTEIVKVAVLLMLPALLTKVTGMVYSLLVSTQLGTGIEINVFNLANVVPQLLAEILLTGAISTLVIPIFVHVKSQDGEQSFLKFYSTIVNLMLAAFAVIAGIVLILADVLFPLIVDVIIRPDGATRLILQANQGVIIGMMRALLLPQLLLGMSVFIAAGINVYNRFLVPQLAPFFYNFGRIFAVLILLPAFNNSPWALVAGVYIGSILHLLVQLPLAKHLGLVWQPAFDITSKYVRAFFRVAWPRLIAYTADITAGTLNALIIAGYQVKLLTVLQQYASSLVGVVPGVIGYAFSVASFPALSRMYSQKEYAEMNRTIIQVINNIFFLAIPLVLAFIFLRLPVVRLVFGLLPGTQFERLDTLMVAWTVLFLSLGVIFMSAKLYLYRLFYVAQNTIVPLFVSLSSLVLTIVLTILCANWFSHASEFSLHALTFQLSDFLTKGDSPTAVGGAALALSIVAFVEFLILLFLVNRFVIPLDFQVLGRTLRRKAIPTIVTAALMYGMYKLWDTLSFPIDAAPGFSGSTTLNLFLLTSLTIFTCFTVYYLLCYLFAVEELRLLRRVLNPIFRLGGLRID